MSPPIRKSAAATAAVVVPLRAKINRKRTKREASPVGITTATASPELTASNWDYQNDDDDAWGVTKKRVKLPPPPPPPPQEETKEDSAAENAKAKTKLKKTKVPTRHRRPKAPTQQLQRRSSSRLPQQQQVVLQFQDDKTGRKLIHPAALRYSLKLVEEELQSTTKSVAQSLLERNQVEESRNVMVRSYQHGKTIVAQVREKLRTIPIPARYVRIDDVALADLEVANKKRIDDIANFKTALQKLQKQKLLLEQEHLEAKLFREQCLERQRQRRQRSREATEMYVHPLLMKQETFTEDKDTKDVGVLEEAHQVIAKPPDDASKVLWALLEQLPPSESL